MDQTLPFRSSFIPPNSSVVRPLSIDRNSRYLQSDKKHVPEHIINEFFHQNAVIPPILYSIPQFAKAEADKRALNPERYQPPVEVGNKKFLVVDEKINYGQPLSHEQMQALLTRRTQAPSHEVITYGRGQSIHVNPVPVEPKIKNRVEVVEESKPRHLGCGCC